MLSFILKYGNVTVYQWKHDKPCPVPVPKQAYTEVMDESCIDWGLGAGDKVVSRDDYGIDFGEELEEDGSGVQEITLQESGITVEGGGELPELGQEEDVVKEPTSINCEGS